MPKQFAPSGINQHSFMVFALHFAGIHQLPSRMPPRMKCVTPRQPRRGSLPLLPAVPELPDVHQAVVRRDCLPGEEHCTSLAAGHSPMIPPPAITDQQRLPTDDLGNAAYRRQQRELTLARIRRMEEDRQRRQHQSTPGPVASAPQSAPELPRAPSVHSSFVKDMVSHTSLVLKPSPSARKSDDSSPVFLPSSGDEDPCESFASSITSLMESSVEGRSSNSTA